MNSDKNEEADMPLGWELCISKKNPNRKYYFNRKTGKSSWTRPQDEDPPENKRSKEISNDKGKPSKEEIKKTLKRKSDVSNTQSSSSKKTKEEKQIQSPIKKRASTGSIKQSPKSTPKRLQSDDRTRSPLKGSPLPSPSPTKRRKTRKSLPSPKPTPSKNSANARLSQLRAELTAEANNEEMRESARPNSQTSSHNIAQTKITPQAERTQKDNNQNESQTTHSPNEKPNENVTSTSPSQFFTANKIIYSMKAQLPDRDKLKAKDAFADIEEGINNQTTEYPFMKHPATPPQFSEASKLMSAIKSKLSYKSEKPIDLNIFKTEVNKSETPKGIYNIFKSEESPINTNSETVTFRSAKDRMESLRTRLSTEMMDTHTENANESHALESMDVDIRETRQIVAEPKSVPELKKVVVSSKENVVLVVDTNIFIHELDFIKNIMNSHIEGYTEQPTLLVPWRVINELDKLKDSNNGNGAICKRARPAMDYLYKSLPESTRIKVQPLRDANSHIYPCESPDDEILNCCLQQAERGKSVILLSNDKNLCNKAVANGVQTKQLRALVLTPRTQPKAAPLSAERLQRHIYTLLSNILENEMRAKYDNLWLHVLFKAPPWSLSDVLQCLLKHWIAVFNEVFPRIEYLIVDLKNSLGVIERKSKNTLTHSEVSNFREICLEVAKRCQIIPEYMELAKRTVDRLERDEAIDSDSESDKDGETVVIDALEGVWTVFSSYCAKLASELGVEHSVEDKLPGSDSIEVLSSKLTVFCNHISTLAAAMEGVLNVSTTSPAFTDSVSRLQRGLADSLLELGISRTVTVAHIRTFTNNCRNMLQEAQGKFSELVQLLTICRNALQN